MNLETFIQYYISIFLVLYVGYYLVPVYLWYYIFFIRKKSKWAYMRVQASYPEKSQIAYEIKHSTISLLILSVMGVFIYRAIENNQTAMYDQISDYGWGYFFLSPAIAFIIHDIFFYWTHRFLHMKPFFKYLHSVHHRSLNPTPFSIYSFQPGEAIIQSLIYPILIFFLPLHPIMLVFFMAYNMFINLAGHSGFEFMPESFTKHKLFKFQNSVTNHDVHHTKFRYNFGFYFTFWDRWMNTLAPEEPTKDK